MKKRKFNGKIYKTMVKNVILYRNMGTWRLIKKNKRALESTAMNASRRFMRIS